jgi:hypothetical protein
MHFIDLYNGYCNVLVIVNECGNIDWIDLWTSFVSIFVIAGDILYYNYLIFYIYITLYIQKYSNNIIR